MLHVMFDGLNAPVIAKEPAFKVVTFAFVATRFETFAVKVTFARLATTLVVVTELLTKRFTRLRGVATVKVPPTFTVPRFEVPVLVRVVVFSVVIFARDATRFALTFEAVTLPVTVSRVPEMGPEEIRLVVVTALLTARLPTATVPVLVSVATFKVVRFTVPVLVRVVRFAVERFVVPMLVRVVTFATARLMELPIVSEETFRVARFAVPMLVMLVRLAVARLDVPDAVRFVAETVVPETVAPETVPDAVRVAPETSAVAMTLPAVTFIVAATFVAVTALLATKLPVRAVPVTKSEPAFDTTAFAV